ncbi:MAG: DUF3996 domain-containing protein [Ignavibacteriae bacterium]|jgi:hypothetical protein|nr:DUF3996 domain-containing protein [Ignavibacteriota bacterium]
MMRKTLLAILILLTVSLSANAQGKFGIGIMLGEPSGLSGKIFISKKSAIDAGIGISFADDYQALQIHTDYLQHIAMSSYNLPLYYGIGAKLKFANDDHPETRFGIRLPVGISWMPDNVPVDLFLEIVPLLDISPSARFKLNGSIGARFYFD